MDLDFTNNVQPVGGAQPPPAPPPPRPTNQPPVAPTLPPNLPPPLPPPPPPAVGQSLGSLPVEEEPRSNRGLLVIVVIGLFLVAGGVGGYLWLKNRQNPSPTTPINPNGTNGNGGSAVIDPAITNRDSQRKQALVEIKKALQAYYDAHQSYPVAPHFQRLDDTKGTIYTALVPSYDTSLPTEPSASSGYWYGYRSVDGKTYELTAQLENKNDPDGAYDLEGNYLYTLTPGSGTGTTS